MEIFSTNDESHTLVSEVWGELYHSRHGAMRESQHVFIKNGFHLQAPKKKSLRIFEMGFGSGLNAWLTCMESAQCGVHVHYDTVESHPVPEKIWRQLNYVQWASSDQAKSFAKIHESNWNKTIQITPTFTLTKYLQRLEDFSSTELYDVIYFDAFAPNTQQELWETPIFKSMFDLLQEGGLLTTYCAKGSVKRSLKAVGFEVEAMPGPPGKREMTVAFKK